MIFVLEQRLIIHLCLIHFPSDIHVSLFLKVTVRLSMQKMKNDALVSSLMLMLHFMKSQLVK